MQNERNSTIPLKVDHFLSWTVLGLSWGAFALIGFILGCYYGGAQ